ncbi:MAG: histidinol-phosphate aminotransferase family protein [Phycisphaerales bacterium]|nr:histidinol-phosphate aminotransferase family protein [Phycisphaerales bacterium]
MKCESDSRVVCAADRIGGLRPYSRPVEDPSISLYLDNNEGSPPSDQLLGALNTLQASMLARYPDAGPIETMIAQEFGVDPSRVILTNGGDDAIDRICRSVLGPGDSMLTHTPGFVMIQRYAQLAGSSIETIPWIDDAFPIDAFLQGIQDRTNLVALISPSNPTGRVIDRESIRAIAERARAGGALLMLDQAYIEFADDDPIEDVLDLENVVIVRTFSKAMGLAGLRVGYAIGPTRVVEWMRTVGGPYPVSAVSIELAQEAFLGRVDRDPLINRTIDHRSLLTQLLESLGAVVLPSQANFVLVKFQDAGSVYQGLLERGIRVRGFGAEPQLKDMLRITVPADPGNFDFLMNSIRDVLPSIGATNNV